MNKAIRRMIEIDFIDFIFNVYTSCIAHNKQTHTHTHIDCAFINIRKIVEINYKSTNLCCTFAGIIYLVLLAISVQEKCIRGNNFF